MEIPIADIVHEVASVNRTTAASADMHTRHFFTDTGALWCNAVSHMKQALTQDRWSTRHPVNSLY